VTDDSDVALYLDRAADYTELRPQVWKPKSDKHLINFLVWKGYKLFLDEMNSKPVSMDELFELEGETNEDELLSLLSRTTNLNNDIRGSQESLCEKSLLREAALQAMPPTSRRCCELLVQGYTRQKIAEKLGMTYDAVAKAITRGIEAAAAKFAGDLSE
jgi:DNA-directed RNA polymerase specialized sigma24 family protein